MASEENEFQNNNAANQDSSKCGPMPKHIPFPDFPVDSEMIFETISFCFTTFSSAMQFINIYRTIWWLPDSFTYHTVNFYLIDPYLALLIVLLTSRRLLYCLLIRLLEVSQQRYRFDARHHRLLLSVLKYSFACIVLGLLGFSVWKIFGRHSYFSLFLLLYPLIVYLLIFGFNIDPFLRTQCEVEGAYFNGMPMHSCSSSPSAIRDEIDVLRNDCNLRIRQTIFTSVVNAYYSGFIPCFFATTVNYNVVWATQHVLFVWLSGFTLCCAFMFPSKYCDILHRSSLHLGYWATLDMGPSSNNLMTATAVPWNKSILWLHSSIIKHSGEYFRSQGPVTVAFPGNSSHSRFFRLFQNPALIYKVLGTLQMCIVLSQIFLIYFALEWHFILSISFITLTNQFTLFKIVRDFFITKRVYTAEFNMSDRQLSALHTD